MASRNLSPLSTNTCSIMKQNIDNNPWAGLSSYEDPATAERKLKFCGRDDDSYDVAKLVMGNIFVTLYGKSGIGKTSLINAGVFPELREGQYTPLSLRLGIRDEEHPKSYQAIIIDAIERTVTRFETVPVIEEQPDEQATDYLWNYYARHRFYDKNEESTTPVVVFDQFEEVFRSNRQEAETLLRQLDYLNDKDHTLDSCIVDGELYRYQTNFRFVVSIREDDLYRLEDSIDNCYLPALKRCRYRLRSLSEQGARDAILTPGEGLFSKDEQEQIAQAIIGIARKKEDNCIGTNVLSLICSRLFLESRNAGQKQITLKLVNNYIAGNPFEKYYNEATKDFSNKEKSYIEGNLIDSTGRRNSVSESDFFLHIKNGETLLEGPKRILQRISVSSDSKGNRIELIHDSFCDAILKITLDKKNRYRNILQCIYVVPLSCILFIIGLVTYYKDCLYNLFEGHNYVAVICDIIMLSLLTISPMTIITESNKSRGRRFAYLFAALMTFCICSLQYVIEPKGQHSSLFSFLVNRQTGILSLGVGIYYFFLSIRPSTYMTKILQFDFNPSKDFIGDILKSPAFYLLVICISIICFVIISFWGEMMTGYFGDVSDSSFFILIIPLLCLLVYGERKIKKVNFMLFFVALFILFLNGGAFFSSYYNTQLSFISICIIAFALFKEIKDNEMSRKRAGIVIVSVLFTTIINLGYSPDLLFKNEMKINRDRVRPWVYGVTKKDSLYGLSLLKPTNKKVLIPCIFDDVNSKYLYMRTKGKNRIADFPPIYLRDTCLIYRRDMIELNRIENSDFFNMKYNVLSYLLKYLKYGEDINDADSVKSSLTSYLDNSVIPDLLCSVGYFDSISNNIANDTINLIVYDCFEQEITQIRRNIINFIVIKNLIELIDESQVEHSMIKTDEIKEWMIRFNEFLDFVNEQVLFENKSFYFTNSVTLNSIKLFESTTTKVITSSSIKNNKVIAWQAAFDIVVGWDFAHHKYEYAWAKKKEDPIITKITEMILDKYLMAINDKIPEYNEMLLFDVEHLFVLSAIRGLYFRKQLDILRNKSIGSAFVNKLDSLFSIDYRNK